MLRAQKFLALCGRPWLAAMLVWLAVLVAVVPQAWAERLPEFLAKTPVAEIFPGADAYGAPEGKPVVARALKGGEPLGYVYLTTDVVNTRGYSSKPIDILVGIANDGTIVGAKLVEHHEPIVLIGIPLLRPYAWLAFASMFVAIAAAMLVQGFLGRQVVRDGGTV